MNFVFLDFDGVVNIFPRYPNELPFFYQEETHNGLIGNYRITYKTDTIEKLNEIFSSEKNQLIWLTTWCEKIKKVEKKIGIKTSKPSIVLDFDNSYDSFEGKANALLDFIDKNDFDKAAWIDDVNVSLVEDILVNKIVFGRNKEHRLEKIAQKLIQYKEKIIMLDTHEEYGMSKYDIEKINNHFGITT